MMESYFVKGLLVALIFGVPAGAAVGVLVLMVVEVFPAGLIGIFGVSNESSCYTDFAVRAFRIYTPCRYPIY